MKYCIALLTFILLISCDSMEITGPEPLRVILDTDMGSDCDDVGALAMLNLYQNRGQVNILGVIYSSGRVPFGCGIIDAINCYYGNGHIPIGACQDSLVGDRVDKMLAEKLSLDTAAFGNRLIRNSDAPDQTVLNRKILAAAPDTSVVYITIGHTRGLHELLISGPDEISPLDGRELVSRKIKKWVALGALRANNSEGYYTKDWNFFFNGTAGSTGFLVDNFPGPAYFVDAGSKVMTGKSLMHTPSGNIVRTAYRDWLWNVEGKTLADQRPSWDLMAVLYAVEAPEAYFRTLHGGYLDFDPEKGCRWIESDEAGKHHFVMQKPGSDAAASDYLNSLISTLE